MSSINFKIETNKPVSAAEQKRRKALLAVPRNALLALIRLNAFGMATLLKKKAFEVNAATTNAQPNGQKWWDIQAKWRNGWNNAGGDWSSLVNAINAGYKKKPLGIKLAPKNIKDKLKSQGIGSYGLGGAELNDLKEDKKGIGEPVTFVSAVTAATGLIIALNELISPLFNNVKKDLPDLDVEDNDILLNDNNGDGGDNEDEDEDEDDEGKNNLPMYLGLAAAAYFLFKS